MPNKTKTIVIFISFFIMISSGVFAQTTDPDNIYQATQNVTMVIEPVSAISILPGTPILMQIGAEDWEAASGFKIWGRADETSSYSLTTNVPNQIITGMIDSPMPTRAGFAVTVEGPAGAVSEGLVWAGTGVAKTLISSIPVTNSSDHLITFRFTAAFDAGPGPFTRIFTLTLQESL